MLQAFLGALGMVLEVMALYVMPLDMAIMLLSTQHLFYALMNYLINKVSFPKVLLISLLPGIVGIVVLCKPELILHT